jgi:predicted Ser/Thr protein kinase
MNEPGSNPNMPQKCPQCGADLPSGALGGLCPACLLKQATSAETATQGESIAFEPPSVDELAKLFPNLQILELIGKGGMGAVYKAKQPGLDRFVALKILPPQVAAGPSFPERFNREARALAKLNHPNIVGIYDFGQVGGLAYLMMEYVDGLNLRQVQRAGKLSAREALQIVPQICEALQFAHDEGIVHRDIKPENILLDKKGRVKIADFGIAKIMGREPLFNLTETRMAIGTPQYMAPEQIEKPQTVDHRADIFSLGVVFYEMLTGELPLGKFAPPSSASRKVQVDVRLDDVVLRALEKEPERRYQQASQVKTAVETISSTQPSPGPGAPDAETLRAQLGARDYTLSITQCFQRAWSLLRTDFWRIVGINALILVLLWAVGAFPVSFGGHGAIPGASIISILLYGPLMGGLYYSYLKRIRGEKVSVETAFSGFGPRFVQLLLGSLVGFFLIGIGLLCLVLPGIYLLVCWAYAIPLIIDKEMDFWPAMSLSRQMVRKHWWKNLALLIVLALVHGAGLLMFGAGILLTAPIATLAFAYAYTEIFASERAQTGTAPAGGTQPVRPPSTQSSGRLGKRVAIGAAAIALILFFVAVAANREHEKRRAARRFAQSERADLENTSWEGENGEPGSGFGPVEEKVVTEGINFKTGELIALPEMADTNSVALDERVLRNLKKAEQMGIDAYAAPQGRGLYVPGGMSFALLANANWNTIRAEEIKPAIEANSNEAPSVLIGTGTNEPATYAFATRQMVKGVLEILGTNAEPAGVKIRYKLVEAREARDGPVANTPDRLRHRLQAARLMNDGEDKDKALSVIAADSAQAGQFALCRDAMSGIADLQIRDETTAVSAKALARKGMQEQALELAKGIDNPEERNSALAELAR